MSNTATRKDIDEVIKIISGFMTQVDERFNQIDLKFNQIDLKFNQIDTRFNLLETEIVLLRESHNRLIASIDGFVGRIDKYESELVARDRQYERLIEWAKKVSKKTGIPLENL